MKIFACEVMGIKIEYILYSNVYFIKHKLKIEQYCHGNKVLEINNKLHSLTNGC